MVRFEYSLVAARKYRRLIAALLVAVLVTGLLLSLAVSTQAASNSGQWVDATSYCGSGACVPLSTTHRTTARVDWKYSTQAKLAYFQNISGSVTKGGNTLCPPTWIKGSSYYTDAGGSNKTISGWVHNGALCDTSTYHCDAYYSNNDYYLYGSAVGHFGSFTNWTTRCIPSASGQHFVNVGF